MRNVAGSPPRPSRGEVGQRPGEGEAGKVVFSEKCQISISGTVQEEVTVQGGWGRRPRGLCVGFRSAKARPFAERKATLPAKHVI